jgi:hypothetical protein
VAENEPLLDRATSATLQRIVVHGGGIASTLSKEVVAEMEARAAAINAATAAINHPKTPPARLQELEEQRIKAENKESSKRETFEELNDFLERTIALHSERRKLPEGAVAFEPPEAPSVSTRPYVPIVEDRQPKPSFWQRLFGGK